VKITSLITISLLILALAPEGDAQIAKKAAPQSLNQFTWIVGTWEAVGSTRTLVERWTRDSAGVFHGISVLVMGKDSTVREKTRIEKDSTGIYFVADVAENKGEVRFKLTKSDSTGVYFENPKHDYPQTISYNPVGTDSLAAWVGGPTKGATQRQGYKFRRAK
jgi:hypothetical protein